MKNKTKCAARAHERAATFFGLLNEKFLSKGVIFVVSMIMLSFSVSAANQTQIDQSIENGVVWLVNQQNADGSWGSGNMVGETGLAVLKLCTHNDSKYNKEISSGLNYIFNNSCVINISNQPAGNPDTNGNGKGVYFTTGGCNGWERTYETSIAIMAIAKCACKTPGEIVNVPGSAVNGRTYKQVLQDAVDYMAFGQIDNNSLSTCGQGGWGYEHCDNASCWSDNSNTGYAVLGLGYASISQCGVTVPNFVKSELNIWVNCTQNKPGPGDDGWIGACDLDGGAGYYDAVSWVNILKTGNLLYNLAFKGECSDIKAAQAVDYLVRHWNENADPGWRPNHFQAMFTTMKGLEACGKTTIDSIDWFDDLSTAIVNNQSADGSWSGCPYYCGQADNNTCTGNSGTGCNTADNILCTEWALLTLQKEVAVIPQYPTENKTVNITVNNTPPYIEWKNETLIYTEYGKIVIKCAVACDENGVKDIADVEGYIYNPFGNLVDHEYLTLASTSADTICWDMAEKQDPDFFKKFEMGECDLYEGNYTLPNNAPGGIYTVIIVVNDTSGTNGSMKNLFNYPLVNKPPWIEQKWELPDEDPYKKECEGRPLPGACEVYNEEQCSGIRGCKPLYIPGPLGLDKFIGCSGTPESCEILTKLGKEKCEKTPLCQWSEAQIYPNPGSMKEITKCAVVCDYDGLNDIVNVEAWNFYPGFQNCEYKMWHPCYNMTGGTGDYNTIKECIIKECGNYLREYERMTIAKDNSTCRNTSYIHYIDPKYFVKIRQGVPCEIYEGKLAMNYTEKPGYYKVVVKATDTKNQTDFLQNKYEYMPCIAIDEDAHLIDFGSVVSGTLSQVTGDNDMSTLFAPTIKNLCNVPVNISVMGTPLLCTTPLTCDSATIPLSQLTIGFDTGVYNLSIPGTYGAQTLPIEPGTTNLENFQIDISLTLPGNYQGTVTVAGVPG